MEDGGIVTLEYAHGNARMIVVKLPECKVERLAVLQWKSQCKVVANQRLINELITLHNLGAQNASRYRDFEKAIRFELFSDAGF